MDNSTYQYFISYSRTDTAFATQLAEQLRKNHVNLWIDQLDIPAGDRWDSAIEQALEDCPGLIVLLSKTSVESENVLDEVSYALEEDDKVIPVLLEPCSIPFRLRRLQYIDLSTNYEDGFNRLLQNIGVSEDPQDCVAATEKKRSHMLSAAGSTAESNAAAGSTVQTRPIHRLPTVNETVSKTNPTVPATLPKLSDRPDPIQPSVVPKTAIEKIEPLSTRNYLIGGVLIVALISGALAISKIHGRFEPPIAPPVSKTTLKYRPKAQDPPQINTLLNSSEVSSRFDISREEIAHSKSLTNALLFGPKVSQDEVVFIAQKLIEQGVEIKVIQQQDTWQEDSLLTILRLKHEIKGTLSACNRNWTVENLNTVKVFDLASDPRSVSGCAP